MLKTVRISLLRYLTQILLTLPSCFQCQLLEQTELAKYLKVWGIKLKTLSKLILEWSISQIQCPKDWFINIFIWTNSYCMLQLQTKLHLLRKHLRIINYQSTIAKRVKSIHEILLTNLHSNIISLQNLWTHAIFQAVLLVLLPTHIYSMLNLNL